MEDIPDWVSSRKKILKHLLIIAVCFFVARLSLFCFFELEIFTIVNGVFNAFLVPFLDGSISALIVSFIIGSKYLNIKSKEELIVHLEEECQIKKQLKISKDNTDSWYFSGGTGSEVRKSVLPDLVKKLGHNKNIKVILQLLDPREKKLCSDYATFKYKRRIDPDDEKCREIQLMVYSTIVSSIYWTSISNIKVEIYLKKTFSTLRYDISDDRVIITKSDPNAPAYLMKKPGPFYKAIIAEFETSLTLAEPLKTNNCDNVFANIFTQELADVKKTLNVQFEKIGCGSNFNDDDIAFIIKNSNPKN